MEINNIKKLNDHTNKSKLKISQPNKTNLVNQNLNINSINKNNLNNNKNKSILENIFIKRRITNIININEESLDFNISESKINILIPDSLNNTKRSKKPKKNISDNNNFNNSKNIPKDNLIKKDSINQEEETKKIDYRYYTNYPIKEYLNNSSLEKKEIKKYWLATYDKMMKKEKILKILNYYNKEIKFVENDIKEKLIEIKDFEIYFPKESNSPLIKYNKNSTIFTKLYLLTIENINILLSYINRKKINISSNELDKILIKGKYKLIDENKNFKYNIIYFMGSFLNINIYGLSNICNDKKNKNNIQNKKKTLPIDKINPKLPSSKKVAKLVKILMNNFPKYNSDFFIFYLFPKIKFNIDKLNEIKNYIYSKNTFDINHKIKDSKCLCELVPYGNSLTGNSMMTPYPIIKKNYFDNKIYNNTFNYIENINNSVDNNKIMDKNPNNNIQLYKEDIKINKVNNHNHKEEINKNIIKILSEEKENIKYNNINRMNFIKIGLKKNNSKCKKKNISNVNEKTIRDNKNHILLYLNKNNNNKKEIKSNINSKNISKNDVVGNKSYNKNIKKENKRENKKVFQKYSININNNSNKINISKLINNKKKKFIQKSFIFNEKIKNKNLNKNEKKQRSVDKLKYNINSFKTKKNNFLLDSLDLNDYLMKSIINKKNTAKNKEMKKEKIHNKGIYIVNRRIKTDIEDDDSSLILLKKGKTNKNNIDNSSSEEFMTPETKKNKKYYYNN